MTPEASLLRRRPCRPRWQVELGADEAIGERRSTASRFRPPPAAAAAGAVPAATPPRRPPRRGRGGARRRLRRSRGLSAAMAAFEGCALKQGARNLVFADGDPRGAGHGDRRGARARRGPRGPALRRAVGPAPRPDARRDRAVAAGRGSAGRGLHHQRAAVAAAAEPRPLRRRGGEDVAVPLPAHGARRARRSCCSLGSPAARAVLGSE